MTARLAVAVWTVALVVAGGAATLAFTSDHEDAPLQLAALAVSAGLAFIGSGLYAWVRRPENRTGALMTAVGFAWFFGALAESNSSLVYSVGFAFGDVVWACFVWLVLAYPSGRLERRFDRGLVIAGLVLTFGGAIAVMPVADSEQLGCADCPANAFLVERNASLASAIIGVEQAAGILLTATVIAVLARRWRRATAPQRRILAPVYFTASTLVALLLVSVAADAVGMTPEALQWFGLAALLAVPLSFAFGLLRTRLATGEVPRRLREAIPEQPTLGEAQDGLRRVLRDPTLELLYRVPDGDAYIDATGRPAAIPDEGPRRAVTPLEYEGRRLALLVHDPSLREEPEFLESVVTVTRVAIERSRLDAALRARMEELRALADEQAALSRVAVAVAAEHRPETVFAVVTEEVGRLLGAQSATIFRFEPDRDETVVVGRWGDPGVPNFEVGSVIALERTISVAQVRERGRAVRVESLEGLPGPIAGQMREFGITAAVAAPVEVSGRHWGAIAVAVRGPAQLPRDAEERLAKFTDLVTLALANAEAHEQLASSRARIVRASDEERRRLERNLHDGAQQRLVTLSLALRLAQSKLPADPTGVQELLERASAELALALEELRELARGLHPAILSDRGLGAALEALAARAPVPVQLREVTTERLPAPVEAAAYYVVAESLTNVAKYAAASAARVSVERSDGLAVVKVEDDGVGGADASRGSGLRGLEDRVEALGGRLHVLSEQGRGTTVRAELPVE